MIRIDKQRGLSYKPFLLGFAFVCAWALALPLGVTLLLRDMPRPSAAFDCDDAAFFAMQRLESLGIKSTAVLGNLKTGDASYENADHIWLLVHIAGLKIPIDWGQLRFGSGYYHGYSLTYTQLVYFVDQDWVAPDSLLNPAGR